MKYHWMYKLCLEVYYIYHIQTWKNKKWDQTFMVSFLYSELRHLEHLYDEGSIKREYSFYYFKKGIRLLLNIHWL